MRKTNAPRHQIGFTLLEVMVAVAVLAIALSAIIKATTEGGANLTYLRDKTLAHWVAENRLAEMQASELFEEGEQRGSSRMAGREWFWRSETSATDIPNLHRVVVQVSDLEDAKQGMAVLTGILSDPQLRMAAAGGVVGGPGGNGGEEASDGDDTRPQDDGGTPGTAAPTSAGAPVEGASEPDGGEPRQ